MLDDMKNGHLMRCRIYPMQTGMAKGFFLKNCSASKKVMNRKDLLVYNYARWLKYKVLSHQIHCKEEQNTCNKTDEQKYVESNEGMAQICIKEWRATMTPSATWEKNEISNHFEENLFLFFFERRGKLFCHPHFFRSKCETFD